MRTPAQKGKNPGPGSLNLPIPTGNRYDPTQTRMEKTNEMRLLIRSLCSIIAPFHVHPKSEGLEIEVFYSTIYPDDFLRDRRSGEPV